MRFSISELISVDNSLIWRQKGHVGWKSHLCPEVHMIICILNFEKSEIALNETKRKPPYSTIVFIAFVLV